jgi:uncharacterized protein
MTPTVPSRHQWQCDMAAFGPDFRNAKNQWLYNEPPARSFWWAIGLSIVLFGLHFIVFQQAVALVVYRYLFGHGLNSVLMPSSTVVPPDFMKSVVVGVAPAGILTILCALWFAHILGKGRRTGLPLHLPRLGFAGWTLILAGFVVAVAIIFMLIFSVFQVDSSTYSPAGGLESAGKNSGMVERTMAELGKNWLMFALALPGVMLIAPIAEEYIFRGLLFNALIHTPLGKFGAVLISATLFALMHRLSPAPWLFVGALFFMGLILGVLLLRFGSLWVPIACHVLWNSISSLAIFGMQS